jgi:lipopolysaccharide/colanic/teichoic acid biosynthesis glycosyltransferase
MDSVLQEEKVQSKIYRHYSVPPVVSIADSKKLEFFYVGKKSAIIDSLIKSFESGYAAENTEHARSMLKRLAANNNAGPDVIIAEASLGHATLQLFSQFLSSQKILNTIPFFIEGSEITETELLRLSSEPLADDVIALNEIGKDRLMTKIRFWKNIRQRISDVSKPLDNEAVPSNTSPSELSKRIFDIVISVVLMVILSPLFLLVMLALRIESKGPLFYISKRAGRGYKIFKFYKFRTMVVEANSQIADFSHLNLYNPLKIDGPVFIKIDNDPRITKLGAFLRKCSLDELPQLLNVFKGDMSLVGNRPLPLYEAATLTTDEWAKRFMAPAGMTGLWQIKKKSKYTMSAEERIGLDINYADKSNFLFDLWIMANTPYAVIQRTNA